MRRVFAALAAVALAATAAQAQTHVLIVSGIGGEREYVDKFFEWGTGMAEAAVRIGVPKANVVYLAEDSTRDPARVGPGGRNDRPRDSHDGDVHSGRHLVHTRVHIQVPVTVEIYLDLKRTTGFDRQRVPRPAAGSG